MLPVTLTLVGWPVFILGHGGAAVRRLQQVRDAGHDDIRVFCPHPDEAMLDAAGDDLIRRWPTDDEWQAARLALIAGENEADSLMLYEAAHAAKVAANVEDVPELCDFHVPSMVRRGDLLLTVATSGKSPGLSQAIRRFLERTFGDEWAGRLDEVAERRQAWRREGFDMPTVARKTKEFLLEKGWLP